MPSYKQTSFNGGINLLLDDSRLPIVQRGRDVTYSEYRLGINIRTRFDVCQPIKSSIVDVYAPSGIKQGILTFGNYVIIFNSGKAYYKLNTNVGWTQIAGFSMSPTVPRYWTVSVPLATTNYGRLATGAGAISANDAIQQVNLVAGTFGNLPGLLVQDGVNQPQFLYIDPNGIVRCRVTQQYSQWQYDNTGINDNREYVPVGTYMEWFNGVLFIVDPTFNYIYRSVSGRPLDFVINIDKIGNKGGDATTTSYSVGVGGISCIKAIPGNKLFVAAGGSACFAVTIDQSNVAVKIFGEWTFNRQVLFNANCLSDRAIIDILGDTVFVAAKGLRSFGSIEKEQNQGRNSIFSANIQSLFDGVTQSATVNSAIGIGWCAAAYFDNYAIFSVKTAIGYALVVYDALTKVYTSLDVDQVGNHAVKQFATITTDTVALYAITDNDTVVQLYSADNYDTAYVRLAAMCEQDPSMEGKPVDVRVIMSNITQDVQVSCSLFTNNRFDSSITTKIGYHAPTVPFTSQSVGTDVGTQTNNIMFPFPSAVQGWKTFPVISWTDGASLTSVCFTTLQQTPLQPLQTQAVVQQS